MREKTFTRSLFFKLMISIKNNHQDNYDHLRFGTLQKKKFSWRNMLLKLRTNSVVKLVKFFVLHRRSFGHVYHQLSDVQSKALLVDLVAYKLLGHTKVKLPTNTPHYWDAVKRSEEIADKNDQIALSFLDWKLSLCKLQSLNYDVVLYLVPLGVLVDFILEQYAYKTEDTQIVAKEGDYVIDAGACFGDTALYFATKVGEAGKVFSFEFIPKNIEIFKKNRELNPHLSSRIVLADRPLWSSSNENFYYLDNGPASKVSKDPIPNADGRMASITIDDYVTDKHIEKIDFIKMDIEGAELNALQGARETICKHKPSLAICVYHNFYRDTAAIANWIKDIDPAYELYLGHYTIHHEETVLFAKRRGS